MLSVASIATLGIAAATSLHLISSTLLKPRLLADLGLVSRKTVERKSLNRLMLLLGFAVVIAQIWICQTFL